MERRRTALQQLGMAIGVVLLFGGFGVGCEGCHCGCGCPPRPTPPPPSCGLSFGSCASYDPGDAGPVDAPSFDTGSRPDVPFATIDAPRASCDYTSPGANVGSRCAPDGTCAGALSCESMAVPLAPEGTLGLGDPVCGRPCDARIGGDGLDSCGLCAACSTDVPFGADRFAPELPTCRPRCVPSALDRGTCLPGFTCDLRSEVCVPACLTDADCGFVRTTTPEGQRFAELDAVLRCNPSTGRCTHPDPVPVVTLGSACFDDLDCNASDECFRSSPSQPMGMCVRFACDLPGRACAGGEVCLVEGPASVCRPTCTDDLACPAGSRCDLEAGACRAPCLGDGDCAAAQTCAGVDCAVAACFCRARPLGPEADTGVDGGLDAGL